MKCYSDDTKAYAVVNNAYQHDDLQRSVDAWADTVKSIDLILTADKCGVLHLGKTNEKLPYFVNGTQLKILEEVKDLGVTMTPDLRFRSHINRIVKCASTKSNLLLRSLAIKNPDPYIRLFNSVVIPSLLYASEVWRPQFRKDLELIQRMVNRFYARVEFRCSLEHRSLHRPEITELMDNKDIKMLHSLRNNDRLDKIFNIYQVNHISNGVKITPKSSARSWRGGAQIASFFAWRTASMLNYRLI
jgi:hypothetical protein